MLLVTKYSGVGINNLSSNFEGFFKDWKETIVTPVSTMGDRIYCIHELGAFSALHLCVCV